MSENLDLVRSIYADWERGDLSRVDWAHPEIELVVVDGVEPGVWRGLGGMARQGGMALSEMDEWHEGAHGYRDLTPDQGADESRTLTPDQVLVLASFTSRGRSTGLDVRAVVARVFEISAGRVTRMTVYWNRDRALADLGLAE